MSFPSNLERQIATAIAAVVAVEPSDLQMTRINGGDINNAYRFSIAGHHYFVKTNIAERLAMFEAEFDALQEIAASKTIAAPLPICVNIAEGQSFIVLEWHDLRPLNQATALRFGNALAALHRCTATGFGWHRDNTIGSTPQINSYCEEWLPFWKERRLAPQLALAARNGYMGTVQQAGKEILERCDVLFTNYSPRPSLLHGDLWYGNAACNASSEPIIFDPACYYGDRETDLAMMELFSGFPKAAMQFYKTAWPLDEGYKKRRAFYNLYHLLNHLNLFGSSYLRQVEATMQEIIIAFDA